MACQSVATVYDLSRPAGTVDEEFFTNLQDEIAQELRLMEAEEVEAGVVAERIEELYQKLHPKDNLRTIPGVGEHTAPVFLAAVGDPERFRSQSAFANWTGVVPGARQSSEVEGKGLRMTKAGPAIMRSGLYQAGDVSRRWDPQLACIYWREMVYHGKTHKQAMGAVMSHLGARVLAVLREDRPYELRDTEGKPIDSKEARSLILTKYRVPDEIRQERRQRRIRKDGLLKPRLGKRGTVEHHRIHEAAFTSQSETPPTIPRSSVYLVQAEISR
jgi:hypothetical protein